MLLLLLLITTMINAVTLRTLPRFPPEYLESVKTVIGGIDEYGCIAGAGYSYCSYTNECHRFDKKCLPIPPPPPCLQ